MMNGRVTDLLEAVRDELLAGLQLSRTLLAQEHALDPGDRRLLMENVDGRIARSREYVGQALRELRRGAHRRREPERALVDEAIEDVRKVLDPLLSAESPTLNVAVESDLAVGVHYRGLQAIVMRLLGDAVCAAAPGTEVQFAAERRPGEGVALYSAHRTRQTDGIEEPAVFERQRLDDGSLPELGRELAMSLYGLQCLAEIYGGWVAVGRAGAVVTVRVNLPAADRTDRVVTLDEPTAMSPGV